MIISQKLLTLYAQSNFNVLLSGRHGVGKTEIIKTTFNQEFEGRWAYFSASTMDAWVDFIGVPKPVERKDGSLVLDLIKPARFHDDEVEALFFDEFNRAPPKVRNAVMELIQFRSINGRKFKNLKVIWAAINPSDTEVNYDVEELDEAQLDRFPIQIDIPYRVDRTYFKNKYNDISIPFLEWWSSLEQELKYKVSPRRLEYAIQVYNVGGKLEHSLPKEANINDLKTRIKNISLDKEWEEIRLLSEDEKEEIFTNISTVAKFEKKILLDFVNFIKYIPADFLIMKYKIERSPVWLKRSVANHEIIPDYIKKEISNETGKDFIETLAQWGRFKIVQKK